MTTSAPDSCEDTGRISFNLLHRVTMTAEQAQAIIDLLQFIATLLFAGLLFQATKDVFKL